MNNVRNDTVFNGIKVENAVQKIIEHSTNAIFIVEGNILRGNIRLCPNMNDAKFIYVTDDMSLGRATPAILSDEFTKLRAKALNNPFGKSYTAENCRQDSAELKSLSEYKNAEIILLQFDDYISQIWQLAMQAYIEQLGITDHIKRLCIDDSSFCINSVDNIDIDGSHNAFYSLMCRYNPINSERYLIEPDAIGCYLDINSPTGKLRDYIRNVSSQFESPFRAYVKFLNDFPKWGLSDNSFFKLVIETLSKDERYIDKIRNWKRIIKRACPVNFIQTGDAGITPAPNILIRQPKPDV